MQKIIFTKCTLHEYKTIKTPPSNIIYYITNVKGKNIFFKGTERYKGAIAISSDSELPKYKDDNFYVNKFYFNYNTGSVYLYKDDNEFMVVQNSWKDSVFDNYTQDVTMDIMKAYHNSNTGNNTGNDNSFGIYIVNELPKNNIKNGIYFVPGDIKDDVNLYTEYIFINNKWEIVGSSQINLSELVKHDYLENILNNYYTKDFINNNYYNKIEIDNLIASIDFSDYATIEFINNTISNYYTKIEIDNIVKSLSSKTDLNELNKSLKSLIDKNILDIQEIKESIKDLDLNQINELISKIQEIENKFNDYTLKSEFDLFKNEINEMIRNLININNIEKQTIQEYYNNLKSEHYNNL